MVEYKEEVMESEIEQKETEEELQDNVVETEESIDEVVEDFESKVEIEKTLEKETEEESMELLSSQSAVEEQESEVKIKRKSDMLVYHSIPLIAKLYESMLKNLGYDVETLTDNQKFLDKLDDTDYRFVIYDIEPFRNMKCMIADIVQDCGAKPFALVRNPSEKDDYCCDVLEEKTNIEYLKKKLEIDLV